jgi:hypothetical protein
VQLSNSMPILEAQSWAAADFAVFAGGSFRVACQGVHSFSIDRVGDPWLAGGLFLLLFLLLLSSPIPGHDTPGAGAPTRGGAPSAGDIYHTGELWPALALSAGVHTLYARVKAKACCPALSGHPDFFASGVCRVGPRAPRGAHRPLPPARPRPERCARSCAARWCLRQTARPAPARPAPFQTWSPAPSRGRG